MEFPDVTATNSCMPARRGTGWVVLWLTIGVFAVLSANPFSSLLGVAFLPVLFRLFWTTRRPAIFFWAFLYQWIQVNAALLWADLVGIKHQELFRFPVKSNQAYVLGMVSLFAVALGVHVVVRRQLHFNLTPWVQLLNPKGCFKVYLCFVAFYGCLPYLKLPGTEQLIVALGFLKWGLFYLVFTSAMQIHRYRGWLVFLIGWEFCMSLFSFFAEFKSVLIYPIIFFFASYRGRLTRQQIVGACLFGFLTINVALIWTAVKMDYRTFLAQGEQGQVIRVSRLPAMEELLRLSVDAIDVEMYKKASLKMMERFFYLDLLSATMDYVPQGLSHEDGAVTLAAVKHVLMPRMLFPSKAVLHDSLHTNKYTGRYIADYKTTSMSIGYVGDFYIDFGFFAPFAVFGLGIVIGLCYYWLSRLAPNPLLGQFFTVPLFLLAYLFEVSLVKMVGMLFTYLLVMIMFRKIGLHWVEKKILFRPNS